MTKAPAKQAPTGTIERRGARLYAKVSLPGGGRKVVRVPEAYAYSEERAREFAARISEGVRDGSFVFDAPKGRRKDRGPTTTVAELVEAWCSGELLETHGAVNGLRALASDNINRWTLEKHALGARVRDSSSLTFGELRVADVTEADVARVVAQHDRALRTSTIAKTFNRLHRLFDLAIFPCGLRREGDNPVSRRLRPTERGERLFSYLYPSELLAVLGTQAVPVGRRVLYALAAYTGLRKGSLFALRWRDIDTSNGTIAALTTKTGVPLLFAVDPSLARLLVAWRAHKGGAEADEFAVCERDLECNVNAMANALRDDLKLAGVTREVLFSEAANVEPIRFHDLRATFCTWARHEGRTDAWISSRSGHQTTAMIERYARAASTLADLRIDPFPTLDGAVPELAEVSTSLSTSAPADREFRADSADSDDLARSTRRQSIPSDTPETVPGEPPSATPNPATARAVTVNADAVELALAEALRGATVAGEWAVVAQLARELEARRSARANVIDLDAARAAKKESK